MTLRRGLTTGVVAVLAIGFGALAAAPANAAVLPKVTYVSPPGSIPAGGGRVTVNGKGFTGVERVLFGSKRATHVTRISSKQLKVTVPPHSSATVQVRVVTAAGKSPNSAEFVYTPPPVITAITPDAGEPTGNVHIQLTGKHFRTVSAATVGGTAAPVAVESDTKVLVTVPPEAAGSYDVVLTNVAGSSVPDKHSRYTYKPSKPWHLVDSVPGTGSGSTIFWDADCESGTCYAAGETTSTPTSRDGVPLIDVEQDGGWVQATVAPPADAGAFKDASLRQVACSAENTCVAFGSDVDWSGSDPTPLVQPLVALGSGQTWTSVHPPMPSNWHAANWAPITDAACFEDDCAVVGWFAVGSSKQLVVDTYADGTWTERSPAATLHGAGTNIFDDLAVSCPSAGHCLAVGRDGRRQPIAVDIPLTGTADATVQHLPVRVSDPHNNVTMDGIDCSTATSCVAVGYDCYLPSDDDQDFGPPHAFFEQYNDGKWTFHHFALPGSIPSKHAAPRWDYPAVSCVAGGTCYVGGAVSVTWKSSRGTEWKYAATVTRITGSGQQSVFAAAPDPYANESALRSVFCGSQATCVAFGFQATPPPDEGGRLTNFSQFSVQLGTKDRPRVYQGPTFDGKISDPEAIACATPTHCVAVGAHDVPDGSGTRSVAWIQES
jgi:hypothetical protein